MHFKTKLLKLPLPSNDLVSINSTAVSRRLGIYILSSQSYDVMGQNLNNS